MLLCCRKSACPCILRRRKTQRADIESAPTHGDGGCLTESVGEHSICSRGRTKRPCIFTLRRLPRADIESAPTHGDRGCLTESVGEHSICSRGRTKRPYIFTLRKLRRADMESAPTVTGWGMPYGIRRGAFYMLPRANNVRPYSLYDGENGFLTN